MGFQDQVELEEHIASRLAMVSLFPGAVINFSIDGEVRHFIVEEVHHSLSANPDLGWIRTVKGRYEPDPDSPKFIRSWQAQLRHVIDQAAQAANLVTNICSAAGEDGFADGYRKAIDEISEELRNMLAFDKESNG